MINKKKTGLCLALAATLIASSALCGCQQSDSSTSAKFNSDVKDASKYTADENAQVYKTLDFSDEQEKEFAKKGFITAPDTLEIKTESGTVAWSQSAYDFIRNSSTPDSANPSLWRNTELNSLYGLFEVVDGVVQNSSITIGENMADFAGMQCVMDVIGDDTVSYTHLTLPTT